MGFVLAIALGALSWKYPKLAGDFNYFLWLIPLVVGGFSLVGTLILAPYTMYRELEFESGRKLDDAAQGMDATKAELRQERDFAAKKQAAIAAKKEIIFRLENLAMRCRAITDFGSAHAVKREALPFLKEHWGEVAEDDFKNQIDNLDAGLDAAVGASEARQKILGRLDKQLMGIIQSERDQLGLLSRS